MSPATLAWLNAFLFTQAVEVPIYLLALRGPGPRRARVDEAPPSERPGWLSAWPLRLAAAFGASLLTHPVVWFRIPALVGMHPYWRMVAVAETFAVVAEGLYFWAIGALPLRRAMLWSLLANATSASLGLLSRDLFGWP